MIRKSRLFVGIALVVQAVSFVALFLIFAARKRSLAAGFLAVAALEGTAGTYLLWQYKEEARSKDTLGDLCNDSFFDDDFDLDESMLKSDLESDEDIEAGAIPVDEDASEDDFKQQ